VDCLNDGSHESEKPLVSVCIANYNGMEVIDDRLSSVPKGATHISNLKTVCAVVVAYYPDAGFASRIDRVLTQVAKMLIVDNTPDGLRLPEIFGDRWTQSIDLIDNQSNKGVAFALNQGLKFAKDAGYEWLLTLDQDTQCLPDMVDTLLAVAGVCTFNPIVIGSNYYDPQANQTKVSIDAATDFLEQKTVITSGSMVDVARAVDIGGFRDDYFIDQVDHEFCLRARANGYRVVISRKSAMTHSVGLSGGVWLPLMGVLPNHPPVRKYYIARNTLVTVARYWRAEPMWCLKRILKLLLGGLEMVTLEAQRGQKAAAFVSGVVDACRGHMGPWENTPTR
jgi:rhamnosyltransferase